MTPGRLERTTGDSMAANFFQPGHRYRLEFADTIGGTKIVWVVDAWFSHRVKYAGITYCVFVDEDGVVECVEPATRMDVVEEMETSIHGHVGTQQTHWPRDTNRQ